MLRLECGSAARVSAVQCIYFIYGLIHFLLIPAVASRDCDQSTEMGQFPLYTQYFAEMRGRVPSSVKMFSAQPSKL